jgi:hypothetical protein
MFWAGRLGGIYIVIMEAALVADTSKVFLGCVISSDVSWEIL